MLSCVEHEKSFITRSDTNLVVQSQEKARSLTFQIYVDEALYFPLAQLICAFVFT